MKLFLIFRIATLLGLSALTTLLGCTNFLAFSDSSAMRIEVEVYKGPLSLEPEIQLEELYGYLLEAHAGLSRTYNLALMNPEDLSGMDMDKVSKTARQTVIDDSYTLLSRLTASLCNLPAIQTESFCSQQVVIASARKEILNLADEKSQESDEKKAEAIRNIFAKQKSIGRFFTDIAAGVEKLTPQALYSATPSDLKPLLLEITRTATAMQVAAFRYATVTTAGQPPNFLVRIAMTFFTQAASEYGNQLEARADVLLKQLGMYGHDRRELPLSAHLRDSEPTDFLHLFEWTDGHIPRGWDYLNFNFSPNVTERIKIVERLYADHFWSKINTVYASGRGKTQMAFIKDETGNWNLKSFENDPTELLDAYTNVAKKALQKAAELAASASTGGGPTSISLARSLVSFATESEPNKAISQTSPAGSLSLDHLRTRLADKLDSTQFKADFAKEAELLGAVDSKEKDVKAAAAKPDTTDSQKQAADNALVSARKELIDHRHQIVARWEAIVSDHSNLVDILSSAVKKK